MPARWSRQSTLIDIGGESTSGGAEVALSRSLNVVPWLSASR